MPLPIKLIAAITTTAAAAATGAYIVSSSRNVGPSTGTAPRSENRPQNDGSGGGQTVVGPDEVILCVDANRVLHANREGEDTCPNGMPRVLLDWDKDEQLCELCDPNEDRPKNDGDEDALSRLDQRLRQLENPTYFEVVNQAEKPIFQVQARGVRMLNQQQQSVAFIGTSDSGLYYSARSTTTDVEASLSASGNNVGVLIHDVNATRIELGSRNAGPFALRLPSGKGLLAGLGQSRAGTGAVLVGSLPGVTQGSITATDGRGMVSLTKDGLPGGLAFTEATIGGGLIDIGNNAGDSAVKMGNNYGRYGIVLTGPVPGLPYVPRSGLPGSYFFGCASGERPACTPTAPE